MASYSITSYFKTKKSTTDDEINNGVPSLNLTEDFYSSCLKAKTTQSHGQCTSNGCQQKAVQLEESLKKLKAELLKIQKAIDVCQRICNTKDIRIQNLSTKQTMATEATKNVEGARILPFQTFSNDFNDEQLSQLRSFNIEKKDDSPFIAYVMRQLYSNDLTQLSMISVTGRPRGQIKKAQMSPRKKKMVEDLFHERLMNINDTESAARRSKVNTHINTAINNIRRQDKETVQKVNLPLE